MYFDKSADLGGVYLEPETALKTDSSQAISLQWSAASFSEGAALPECYTCPDLWYGYGNV